MRKTLRSSGPHHWLPLICLAVLVASAVLAPVRAEAYWFETYLRTVKLIDAGEVTEASALLDALIREYPTPDATIRIPGNQFLDYFPYYQRARIELARGDFEGASHSLDVSDAFGSIREDFRTEAEVTRMRAELERARIARRGSASAAVEPDSDRR